MSQLNESLIFMKINLFETTMFQYSFINLNKFKFNINNELKFTYNFISYIISL